MSRVLALGLLAVLALAAASPAVARPAGPADRARLIERFPEDVRPLLSDLPAGLIDLLWEVRQEGPGTLTWQDAGGEFHEGIRRAFLDEWKAITRWNVRELSAGGEANNILVEMVKNRTVDWDVTEIGSYGTARRLSRYLEPTGNMYRPPARVFATRVLRRRWVNVLNYSTMILYNTDVYGDKAPQAVSDFFDTKTYPGKRCIYDGAQYGWNLEYALIADGVPVAQVYDVLSTTAGRKRAFAKLDTIKNDLVFWGTGAESVQFVLDGQCDLGFAWNGRPFRRLRDEPDLPLASAWDGAFVDGDPFAIPRGAPHIKAARSALAYALRPRNTCDLMNETGYGIPFQDQPFPHCLTPLAKEWAAHAGQRVIGPPDTLFWLRHDKELNDAWADWKTQ